MIASAKTKTKVKAAAHHVAKNATTKQTPPPAVVSDKDGVAVSVDRAELESAVRAMLAALGEDGTREGIADTPKRVAKAMAFAVRGYGLSLIHI